MMRMRAFKGTNGPAIPIAKGIWKTIGEQRIKETRKCRSARTVVLPLLILSVPLLALQ